MRSNLIFILVFIFQLNLFSQTHEESLANAHFSKTYKKEESEKVIHNLTIINNLSYLYHEDTISLENNLVLKSIVKNGLLYPLYKNNDNVPRKYSLYSFLEIPTDKKNVKRFKIWSNSTCRKDLDEVCLLNPTQYYFELESSCIEDCEEDFFYKNAKLTYLSRPEFIL